MLIIYFVPMIKLCEDWMQLAQENVKEHPKGRNWRIWPPVIWSSGAFLSTSCVIRTQKSEVSHKCWGDVFSKWHFWDNIHSKCLSTTLDVESSWNVMAHGDAREGKLKGNWRMEWVASTLHATSEHGVSSITTADAHNSATSSRQNWLPCRYKWTRPFRRKKKAGFCAYVVTFQTRSASTGTSCPSLTSTRACSVRLKSRMTVFLRMCIFHFSGLCYLRQKGKGRSEIISKRALVSVDNKLWDDANHLRIM